MSEFSRNQRIAAGAVFLGLHYDFSDKIDRSNIVRFRGLTQMATQIACFMDRGIPPSDFHPAYVRFNDILPNCLPEDHVGTPKTLLPAFR